MTPDKGYEAAKWFVNGEEVTEGISTVNSDNDTFTYTVTEKDTEPVRVMAQLAQTGNKLTFGARSVLDEATAGGTVTAVNNRTGNPFYSGNTLAADSSVTFTAAAAENYELVGWEMDGQMVSGETGDTFTREIAADRRCTTTTPLTRACSTGRARVLRRRILQPGSGTSTTENVGAKCYCLCESSNQTESMAARQLTPSWALPTM